MNKHGWRVGEKVGTAKDGYVKIEKISLNAVVKTIILASENYANKTANTPKVNLVGMPHGANDRIDTHIPLFIDGADEVNSKFNPLNTTVLVHCKHGCSRTGSVVAVYLINYEGHSADEAISLVDQALTKRFNQPTSIDLKNAVSSYGRWIKDSFDGQKVTQEKMNEYIRQTMNTGRTTRSKSAKTPAATAQHLKLDPQKNRIIKKKTNKRIKQATRNKELKNLGVKFENNQWILPGGLKLEYNTTSNSWTGGQRPKRTLPKPLDRYK